MNKIKLLLQTYKELKNWKIILKVYFGIYKKKYFMIFFRNGLKCTLRTKSTDIQAFANVWLEKEYEKIGFKVDTFDNIIDVGAHIGLFTMYLSQFCKKGKIISCEPIKENYELLQNNIKLNKLSNVKLYNLAISEKEEKVKIYLDEFDDAAHSIYGKGIQFQEINSKSIKSIIDENKLNRCKLKLDCEGSEYKIIQSIPEEYFNRIDAICLEYHIVDNNSENLISLKKNLESMNYTLKEIRTSNIYGLLHAVKNNIKPSKEIRSS